MSNNNHNPDISRFLSSIWKPGDVREIRSFSPEGYTYYGYFNNSEKAAQTILKLPNTFEIYVTLNPCKPELLARCCNRIKKCGKKDKTTSDNDIRELRYLLVDCDPERPAGISATEEELNLALVVAKKILTEKGNPRILGISGNGCHLLYPHDAKEPKKLSAFLKELNEQYGGNGVSIDTKVYNPARITKVMGTWARKGDSTEERPHRQSYIIEINENPTVLPIPEVTEPALAKPKTVPIMQAKANAASTKNRPDTVVSVKEADREHNLEEIQIPRNGNRRGWKRQVIDQMAHNWQCFYESQGIWGIKPSSTDWLRGFPAGEHSNQSGGFCFRNDNGYYYSFYTNDRGFPQQFLMKEKGIAEEDAWQILAEEYAHVEIPPKMTREKLRQERVKQRFLEQKEEAERQPRPFTEIIQRLKSDGGKAYVVALEGIFEETIETNELVQSSFTTYEKICDDPVIVQDRIEIKEEEESAYVTLLLGKQEKVVPMDYLLAKNADELCKRGIRIITNLAAKAMAEYFQLALKDTQVRTIHKTLGWHEGNFVIPGLVEEREILHDTVRLGYKVENGNEKVALEAIKSLAKVVEDGFLALLIYSLLPPAAKLLKLEPFKFVLAVLGQTGNFKTTLCKKGMALYGIEFLGNQYMRFAEGATDNAIIKTCALARHLPVLVDNYKPNVAGGETRLIQIISMIVEGKDKQRLNQKGDFRDAPELAAWAIFTGEAWIENDTSAIARCLTIEFHKTEKALEYLQFASEREEHLPALGYAWLNWLRSSEGKKSCQEVRSLWYENLKDWSKRAYKANVQNAERVAANFASMVQCFEVACKCPLFDWLEENRIEFMAYLQNAIVNMGYTTKEAREGVRFLLAVSELLASGRVLLCKGKNSKPALDSTKTYIGWDCKEENVVYLLPQVVLWEVQRLADVRITKNALYRQLEEEDAIAEKGEWITVTKWLGGAARRVLSIKRENIISE